MSQVSASDGSLVATFAEQRRMLIEYRDIPQLFQHALIATEDSSFMRHTGIDIKSIMRAAWNDLRHLKLAQGASTLTQQLARSLFLHPEKTFRRKLQEAMLALEIERQYTKQEILRFYCNQIYMGHGRYGLEAASRYYFKKPAIELSLTEAATLAGLIQRPEALSPLKNPPRALERRNHVLRRMVVEGFITSREAAAAQKQPLDVAPHLRTENPAPYFVEEIRRWLQERYGSSGVYKEGLEVNTTLDPLLQGFANRAMDVGLRQLDKRQGWRGVQQRVPDGEEPASYEPSSWSEGVEQGEVHDGVVLALKEGQARVRVGPYVGMLGSEKIAWTGKKSASKLLRAGDILRVRLLEIGENGTASLSLEQEPLAEAALVALDPSSGEIRALVGGFNFERSEWNRAVQATRQTGSAFKPFVYAAALGQGKTLASTLLDRPTVFLDPKNPDPYQPENYYHTYYETVTVRTALEKSANIATVKLLDQIGYGPVIQTARRLGIKSSLRPFPSLALGSFEITLLELTSAYGTFANQGVYVEPHLVREVLDREGTLIARIEPEVRDAVSPETAFLMNRVLGGVISDGTGRAAASLGMNLAGKTGTTDNNTDAWFVGYAPTLAVGVWVGFDEPRSLGSKETGAQAALPIWRSFMEQAKDYLPNEEFYRPSNITVVAVDRKTGLKANLRADCDSVISEVFIKGSEPTAYCSRAQHQKLAFPYPFQRYPLNEQGAIVIPERELAELLDAEMDVFLVDGASRLEAHTDKGVFTLPLQVIDGAKRAPPPRWLRERFDITEWRGLDGRKADIVFID
jgi:penicillin-binding protein 1A